MKEVAVESGITLPEDLMSIIPNSPVPFLEDCIGALHCFLGGAKHFVWKKQVYNFVNFKPVLAANKLTTLVNQAFLGHENVEVIEVSETSALVRENGISQKYNIREINGVVIMEKDTKKARKPKPKCIKECSFNKNGKCKYDPLSDEAAACDDPAIEMKMMSATINDLL